MCSNAHHPISSSLSSDYALIAASQNGISDEHNDNDLSPDHASHNPRPTNPSIHKRTSFQTERTPLLSLSVPRIHEDVRPTIRPEDFWTQFAVYFEELKIVTKYTFPVLCTYILEYSLIVAGTVSIGHLSTTALAAGALATMTANVTGFSILQGFVSALDTLLPSAWTSSQPNLVGLWCLRISFLMFCSLFPILIVWFNSEPILLLLRQDPEVAQLAALYLKYLSLSLPGYAINNISRRYFQSQGLFTVPTRIIMVVAPINVALNYLLVWGPQMFSLGFIGAPIASAISFNLMAILSIMYGIFFVPKTAWHPISGKMFTNLGLLSRLGIAGVGQVGSEWWSWELVGLAASLLGPVTLAAQSALLVSASMAFQSPFSLSVAASVRIGNLLGDSDSRRAAIATHTSLFVAFLIALVMSAAFMMFRESWGYIFNNDPEVVHLVSNVLPIVALFQVFDGLACVSGGILRAQGRQTTGAMLNISAYYLLGIPTGIFLAFKSGMELNGLWIGLTISLVYCAVAGTYLCLNADWNQEVKKVQDRLEADKRPLGSESDDPVSTELV